MPAPVSPPTPAPPVPATPDPGLPSVPQAPTFSVDPGPAGASLWNMQTQAPEWVPLDQVSGKLASGAYRSYAGSQTSVVQGIGSQQGLQPSEASTTVAGGGQVTHPEAQRDLTAREQQYSQQFDTAGDKALAYADGVVSGLTGGLLKGVPQTNEFDRLEQTKNLEEHPGYEGLGELTALAATLVAPESALKYTPLGGSNKLFEAASAAVDRSLVKTIASGAIRKGVADAAAGALASGVLSSAHTIGDAVNGEPVSGYAIMDDIGIGAIMAGGIGAVAEGLTKGASKITDARKQIQAAAEFDKTAMPIRGVLTDVSKSWNTAHNVAGARVEALQDMVDSGLLDTETPGREWLKARTNAKATADTARDNLVKIAGTDDPVAIATRLHDLAVSGKAKEAEKMYKAFDEWGTAVSNLDDAIQPTSYDMAHLHDVIGDLDEVIPASHHPLQALEKLINEGAPDEVVNKFSEGYDERYLKAKREALGQGGPNDVTRDLTPPSPTGGGKVGRVKQNVVHEDRPEFNDPRFGPPDSELQRMEPPELDLRSHNQVTREEPRATEIGSAKNQAKLPPGQGVREGMLPGDEIGGANWFGKNAEANDKTMSILRGGSLPGNEEAGFRAKQILSQARQERATGVMSPVRPTALGKQIQQLVDQLSSVTGGRLGTPEARALANELGMNTAAMKGPVATTLADLWSLHRVSEQLAESLGRPTVTKFKNSLLIRAVSWGTVSGTGAVAHEAGGAFAGGAARSVARQMLGAALYGAGALSATAGRFRQAAVNNMAKILAPGNIRAAQMGAIMRTVTASYAPKAQLTSDYETKAAQLRAFQQNPEPARQHLQQSLQGLGGVNPQAYTAAVNAGISRMQNLAKALPVTPVLPGMTLMARTRGPSQASIEEFHRYEAVTADRELVFKYLKSGNMPQGVIDAMNEQHPDFMQQMRDYAMENPQEIQNAPFATQVALSKLMGVPLVPEATPQFVSRMQQPYIEAKQKEAQAKQQMMGAAAIKAGIPTAAQALAVPPTR